MSNRAIKDVSIVIPVYNRYHMLRGAIASCLDSAVGLSLQIIVVDDASPEPVGDVAASFPIQYIRLENNQGSAFARNRGMAHAVGRYIKFLDSDDLLEPGSLHEEYELAIAHDADIVISGWNESTIKSDGTETLIKYSSPPMFIDTVDDLLRGLAVPTSSALYKRKYLKPVEWDSRLAKLNDWDFFMQAALKEGKILSLDRPSYRWRHHPGARITDASLLVNAREFFAILDKLSNTLESTNRMDSNRRQRLAQYYYKELRMAFRFDTELGERYLEVIYRLSPEFLPHDEEHSRIFRLLPRLFPLRAVLLTYGLLRRGLDRLTSDAA